MSSPETPGVRPMDAASVLPPYARREPIFTSPAAEAEVRADYDSILGEWPVSHTEMVVPTRLGQTNVLSCGPAGATDLVLLHGAGTHAMSWVYDIAAYARLFRTHVVDTPGDPGRSDPVRAGWRTPAYAEWLSDVLDGLGIGQTHLVGISQGGWNALRFAGTFPTRLHSLVLLTPAGVRQPRASFLITALPLLMLGQAGRRLVNRLIAGHALDARALSYVDHLAADFRPRVGIPPVFTDEELAGLPMPVLVMVGDRDVIYSAHRVTTRIQRLVPRATTLVVPGAGHVLLGAAAAVTDFLSRDTDQP
jgi:pimeloyl-ACP methyl ester carboxylesterase